MAMLKKKGFTLLELIAVLVIMAILALIVTPLVMNMIRKARISADKRSIDAYGRSIELAITGYLLDNGKFPTSVEDLTIEYSGNEVVCSTTQLNTDSYVYLTGCTVGGRTVDYEYRTLRRTPTYTAYSVGDYVSYNGVTYYVIENSDTTSDTVKLLKEKSLTKTEMDDLGLTGITISESNGYGTVQYGSSTDYSTSTVRQVVDKWAEGAVKPGDTATARLINITELTNNLGYEYREMETTQDYSNTEETPTWVFGGYYYWTMTPKIDSSKVWIVTLYGTICSGNLSTGYWVRPVLEISKSADITKLSS